MIKVAVTGNIGSGKTEFIKFISKLGFCCISSDAIISKLYKDDRTRKILAPKIVNLLDVKETMVKISIPEGNKSSVKGWIPIDDRLWGVSDKETQILND